MAASCWAEPPIVAVPRCTFDFSAAAGPLPPPVAHEVAEACRDWRGQGSVLSLPFTSDAFAELMTRTRARLVDLLAIPDSHDVLFLQGGASAQFGLVPLNLLGAARAAAYVESGHWSRRAIGEARRYCDVHIIDGDAALASGDAACEASGADAASAVAYLHLTSNETADGLQFRDWPRTTLPLVVDMTSDLLTRRIDWPRIGLAYAALQKAIGVPGLTVVVVRRDLFGRARADLPRVFDYTAQSAAGSRLNTPPVFAIFVAHAMLGWIAESGGLGALESAIARRSARVYRVLDEAAIYRAAVPVAHRSRTSICFGVGGADGNERCIAAAHDRGIVGLRGHPQAGGLRAAIYPGTGEDAVDRLCEFLTDFRRRH